MKEKSKFARRYDAEFKENAVALAGSGTSVSFLDPVCKMEKVFAGGSAG